MSENVDTSVPKSSHHKAKGPDVQSTMLPAGFTTIRGPNGTPAIIEQYMVPATATAFDGLCYKDLFKVDRGAAGVSAEAGDFVAAVLTRGMQPRDLESYEPVLLANGTVNADPSPVRLTLFLSLLLPAA